MSYENGNYYIVVMQRTSRPLGEHLVGSIANTCKQFGVNLSIVDAGSVVLSCTKINEVMTIGEQIDDAKAKFLYNTQTLNIQLDDNIPQVVLYKEIEGNPFNARVFVKRHLEQSVPVIERQPANNHYRVMAAVVDMVPVMPVMQYINERFKATNTPLQLIDNGNVLIHLPFLGDRFKSERHPKAVATFGELVKLAHDSAGLVLHPIYHQVYDVVTHGDLYIHGYTKKAIIETVRATENMQYSRKII